MTIVTPPPAIPRDRWQRPLVTPPEGGKATAYTRCTTFVGCIEDTYNLSRWQMRQVALGLAESPDLMLGIAATDAGDKKALDKFCEDALERAKSHAAATTGTALHALTELVDRGEQLPVVPASAKADLDAYAEATADLKATHIETFCVQDPLKVGGTPDRVVKYQGKHYIADIKTGSIEWGPLKIAAQLAMYARSRTYDVATGQRGTHDADLHRGIIIHLPAGQARCDLYWVDLAAGWEAVKVARQVREQRALRFADLTEPFGVDAEAPTPTLAEQIKACATAQAVRDLWQANSAVWTPDLTEIAKSHIHSLPTAS